MADRRSGCSEQHAVSSAPCECLRRSDTDHRFSRRGRPHPVRRSCDPASPARHRTPAVPVACVVSGIDDPCVMRVGPHVADVAQTAGLALGSLERAGFALEVGWPAGRPVVIVRAPIVTQRRPSLDQRVVHAEMGLGQQPVPAGLIDHRVQQATCRRNARRRLKHTQMFFKIDPSVPINRWGAIFFGRSCLVRRLLAEPRSGEGPCNRPGQFNSLQGTCRVQY